jgi:hypothetical protein
MHLGLGFMANGTKAFFLNAHLDRLREEKRETERRKSVVGCRGREVPSLPPPGFVSSFSSFRAREVFVSSLSCSQWRLESPSH